MQNKSSFKWRHFEPTSSFYAFDGTAVINFLIAT
jgi:hypothetical protein